VHSQLVGDEAENELRATIFEDTATKYSLLKQSEMINCATAQMQVRRSGLSLCQTWLIFRVWRYASSNHWAVKPDTLGKLMQLLMLLS